MANHHAIAAVGQTILGVLSDACPRPEFEGCRFELYQSSQFSKPMEEGISLYLYRVAANATRRNLPPRIDTDGRKHRAPLPLDLFYMLTPWARTAERQHRLLGWAMRTLDETPTLHAALLNHFAAPDRETFASDETITVIQEPISVQDMFNLWDFAKHNIQVSVTYVVRLVPLDSLVIEDVNAHVQTRGFDMGKRAAS